MNDLFRLREVPDPDGSLEDALADLIDNSALVEVTVDYEAAAEALFKRITNRTLNTTDPLAGVWRRDAKAAVDAALGLTEEGQI